MKSKYWWMIKAGKKVSRKTKKKYLGKRLGKAGLNKLLDSVQIIPNKYPKASTILPYPFCPKCGCTESRSTGNMAEHPELWVRSYCLKCSFLVGEVDNSPFTHALEYKEWGYQMH